MVKPVDTSKILEKTSLVLLMFGAFIVLLPLAIAFLTSLTPPGGNLPEAGPTLANYQEAWQRGNFLLAIANSTLVALAVTAFQVITSALAGSALLRVMASLFEG